jgi:NAD(P)-dependent dehydrogenase (short-subunit alcohol dehydrogenase family)
VSAPPDASKLLRPGVLEGVIVLLAGDGDSRPGSFTPVIAEACGELGAKTLRWRSGEAVSADADVLVVDAASSFSSAPLPAPHDPASATASASASAAALRHCLDEAWQASHVVANAAFIDAQRPGRIIYLAPRSRSLAQPDASHATAAQAGAGHADAARAGLENLARTLSIEWARYAITTVALAPGARTTPEQVASVVAYLASAAGAYFSGCQLDLRGPPPGV